MTVIAGLEHDGKVTLAADRLGSNRASKVLRRDEKLVKVTDQLILAFTGSYRQGQVLRWRLQGELPDNELVDSYAVKRGEDAADKWMNTTFIDAVRKVLADHGARRKENEVEEGATFLAAFGSRLYCVEGDNQVGSPDRTWETHGSGWGAAAGALSATEDLKVKPERRLELAVLAACENVPSCGLGPTDQVPMLSTKGAGK